MELNLLQRLEFGYNFCTTEYSAVYFNIEHLLNINWLLTINISNFILIIVK